MTEAELQRAVEHLCDSFGLLYHHCRDGRMCSGPGMPDLVIIGSTVLWVELKSSTGWLKPVQTVWKRALIGAGQEWRLWNVVHWESGEIRRTLETLCVSM